MFLSSKILITLIFCLLGFRKLIFCLQHLTAPCQNALVCQMYEFYFLGALFLPLGIGLGLSFTLALIIRSNMLVASLGGRWSFAILQK
jgi:hypothetical protein